MGKLRSETSHDEILHWGRIEGTVKDYHIAQGLNFNGQSNFPKKTFYWCSSRNFNFAELHCPNKNICEKVEACNSKFTGEYDTIICTQEGEAKEIYLDEEDALPIIIKPKNITELDRLSLRVHQIEH
jgi:hypothetical protein